jgi:hypothetical protein
MNDAYLMGANTSSKSSRLSIVRLRSGLPLVPHRCAKSPEKPGTILNINSAIRWISSECAAWNDKRCTVDQGRIKTEGHGVLEDRLIAGHLEDYCKLTWRYELRCARRFRTARGRFEQKFGVFPNTYDDWMEER